MRAKQDNPKRFYRNKGESMNRVTLIGILGKDPEISQTSTGISICKFSLATQRKFKNADGKYDTDWHNISVWRDLGELSHKYLHKGNKCAIVGTIQYRSYEDKEGNKKFVTDIIADEVEFLTPKDKDEESTAPIKGQTKIEPTKRKTVAQLEPVDDDDLPF
jgi:single-strand DNA-binding protein